MSNVLSVEQVAFRYRRRQVLEDVCWSLNRGVNVLLGPNGAGKSTLIRCIVGLSRPSSGDIRVLGTSVRKGGAVGAVGYVPQRPQLPGLCRVRDAIEYAAWLQRVDSSRSAELVDNAIGELGLAELADRRIRSLSGGQVQRVALAAGVVHKPALVVLDEPTVGLDPAHRLRAREAIQRIGRQRTVLISTHLTEDVEYLADTVGILAGGSIQFAGRMDEFTALSETTRDGTRPGSAFEQGYDRLVSAVSNS